jgi:hypothetical protein
MSSSHYNALSWGHKRTLDQFANISIRMVFPETKNG